MTVGGDIGSFQHALDHVFFFVLCGLRITLNLYSRSSPKSAHGFVSEKNVNFLKDKLSKVKQSFVRSKIPSDTEHCIFYRPYVQNLDLFSVDISGVNDRILIIFMHDKHTYVF